jgi:hypothetical protein
MSIQGLTKPFPTEIEGGWNMEHKPGIVVETEYKFASMSLTILS